MASQHGHSDAHAHGAHGSLKTYVIGFVLSLILTVLSFGCVMSGAVPQHLVMPGIVVFCVAQLLVQLVFFLHMSAAPGQRDNLSIGVFTLLIIAIVVVGSLWVMHNMNAYMIPSSMQMSSGSIG
ncbi:cytochrome o ubiquinol oxidase subunit IV [Dyella mobilis]|uniref:Cytochrome bo(3) ubiquinol oxidase subunit 4 n=1 Tax=Dyella mobilis TaxID=1849582 RepID=A0ABS2KJP8_9GAMM|nr:cytochrome o ubiquinol oxidase subunit IV [Dyella mobilis]MBM7131356.1 cytochrome o ubiquinol oxidase subunit IV [Dyella mobilis]GLQ98708.1 cytochrome o ubiquinol oxidase subunit IV [Dyella mobilis]